MKTLFTLLLIALLSVASASEKKKAEEDVDLVSLAALLTNDGFYHRANDTLNQVDTTEKNFNFSYFYTLRGVVANKMQDYSGAVKYFEQALEYPQTEKSVHLYIAEASYKMKDYKRSVQALDDAGDLASSKANLVAFRAEAYWKLKEYDKALGTLDRGYERFNKDGSFLKQKFFYLVQLSLFQEAFETSKIYLASGVKVDAQTYLAFATTLRKNGEIKRAIAMLEEGRLRFKSEPKLTVLLAHLYVDQSQLFAAANLFENASYYEREYTKESSELYRRAKAFVHALYLNSQVLDQKEKLKQRLAIYVEFAEYDRAIAMHPALERSGLLENEDIRYALAYTYYMNAQYDKSEAILKTLTKPDLFSKGITLRNNMEKCRANRWDCI
ncbi:MAG: CDC27 family protein [Campylobacterota bacterium]|nr:CDC27 family protein [Campylobacterota bacterium]